MRLFSMVSFACVAHPLSTEYFRNAVFFFSVCMWTTNTVCFISQCSVLTIYLSSILFRLKVSIPTKIDVVFFFENCSYFPFSLRISVEVMKTDMSPYRICHATVLTFVCISYPFPIVLQVKRQTRKTKWQ